MIDKYDYLKEVAPKDGVAFYFFVAFHLARFAGTTSISVSDYPYYQMKNGEFQFIAPTGLAYKIRQWFQRLYSRSSFYEAFEIELPPFTDSTYRNFARMLKMIEKKYLETFDGKNTFVVVFYPHNTSYIDLPRLKSALNSEKIKFIDLSEPRIVFETERPLTLIDGHPNLDANEILADLMERHLERF